MIIHCDVIIDVYFSLLVFPRPNWVRISYKNIIRFTSTFSDADYDDDFIIIIIILLLLLLLLLLTLLLLLLMSHYYDY